MTILGSYNNWKIIHCIDSIKQNGPTNTGINNNIKHNYISNIALKIGRDIRDNYYGAISTIGKRSVSRYYLVKWTCDSYNYQSFHETVKDVTNYGELECAVVYLNTFATFKQWYIPCENEIQGQTVVMLNNVI